MNFSCFALGLLSGSFIGVFFAARYYRNVYKHLIDLIPGVTFENRLMVQAVLALFPPQCKEIFVFVKKHRYKVFKDQGDVKYIRV